MLLQQGAFLFLPENDAGGIYAVVSPVSYTHLDVYKRQQQYNGEGSVFNSAVPGIYLIIFSISNSAGDVERFQAQVEIYDPAQEVSAPKLYLKEYLIYLEKGDYFDPMDYLLSLIHI